MQELFLAAKAQAIDGILHKYTLEAEDSPRKVLGAAFAVLKTNGVYCFVGEAFHVVIKLIPRACHQEN